MIWQTLLWYTCRQIRTGSTPGSSIYLEQTFVFRVNVQLIFKNVRRNKKVYTRWKSEKIPPRQIQHHVIDLKMELLVKIVINLKLQTAFVKRSILDVSHYLSSPLTAISQTFFYKQQKSYITVFWKGDSYHPSKIYLFKANNRNNKNTRARCEIYRLSALEWHNWH